MAAYISLHYLLILLILLILSPTFFHQTCKLVQADHSLIENQCHNANVPATCLQCVESDPEAKTADQIGIAIIVVRCLSNHSSILVTETTKLARKAKDKDSKHVFESCSKGFSTANKYLSDVAAYLTIGEYGKAATSVLEASQNCNICQVDTKKLSEELPTATIILYEIGVFGELTDAVMRMIDRF
ncbi:pectinesterase inhibitor [Tripterygium wilfordii]|uniref:Pectinesterase inhibitor n=1 Tax=Tripterygium wilfordii TaxID=458696 RepID=A0A7J7C264_TRIWF|nr:pectinesterase inhibitor-like [Tripterygium wilfordii]KAF5728198.1 pectinesterase inhibitor [Tripterygium wilfordii]